MYLKYLFLLVPWVAGLVLTISGRALNDWWLTGPGMFCLFWGAVMLSDVIVRYNQAIKSGRVRLY